MDDKLSKAVLEAFMRMHKEKLIYRAQRLVNWDSQLKSAVSDLEVDYITLEQPEKLSIPGWDKKIDFGWFWEWAYKVTHLPLLLAWSCPALRPLLLKRLNFLE